MCIFHYAENDKILINFGVTFIQFKINFKIDLKWKVLDYWN